MSWGPGQSPVSTQPEPPRALGATGRLEPAVSPPRPHCLLSHTGLTGPPARVGTELLSFKCFSRGLAGAQCSGKSSCGCAGKVGLESRLVVSSTPPRVSLCISRTSRLPGLLEALGGYRGGGGRLKEALVWTPRGQGAHLYTGPLSPAASSRPHPRVQLSPPSPLSAPRISLNFRIPTWSFSPCSQIAVLGSPTSFPSSFSVCSCSSKTLLTGSGGRVAEEQRALTTSFPLHTLLVLA